MLICKQIEIDMAHRVPNHKTKCKNLHGHRYVIEVGVDDKIISEKGKSDEGMVIDFGDLKAIMMEFIDGWFDHNSMFYENDPMRPTLEELQEFQDKEIQFVPFIPTAENIAKFFYQNIEPELKKKGIQIAHVKIWETPTSTAVYSTSDILKDKLVFDELKNKKHE